MIFLFSKGILPSHRIDDSLSDLLNTKDRALPKVVTLGLKSLSFLGIQTGATTTNEGWVSHKGRVPSQTGEPGSNFFWEH